MDMTLELKICGLTTLADMRLCEALGADYVGMVVEVPSSPRAITGHTARYLCPAAKARPVLVVADLAPQQIGERARLCRPAAIQVHGAEDLGQVQELREQLPENIQIWRALGLPPDCEDAQATAATLVREIEKYAELGVARIVLDTRVKDQLGGTGVASHWPTAAEVIKQSPLPVMLAGGLTPENVAAAIRETEPAGVDIASGVERQPGRKDPGKLRQLAHALAPWISP